MLTEKQLDPQNGGNKQRKMQIRKRTGRRVGNVFVSVSDLHNIFVYFYTTLY